MKPMMTLEQLQIRKVIATRRQSQLRMGLSAGGARDARSDLWSVQEV